MTTLFGRIGGEASVDAAVDNFYRKVYSNDRVNSFIDDVNIGARCKKKAIWKRFVEKMVDCV